MLSKLAFLIAVILFVVAILADNATWHPLGWGFVAVAVGLLLEGFGPGTTILVRRSEPQ